MEFIRRFIEQKISAASGAEVRIGELSFSPLSGGVEVRELAVGSFLAVKKIEAKISIARAVKQEIVVRSLAIEEPVITINRNADGKLNLPAAPSGQIDSADQKKSWEFEAHKVLVVGGRVVVQDAGGYQMSLEKIIGSVEMKSPGETEFVFAAGSLDRRDQPVELGEARLLGKLAGGLNLTLSAGSMLDLSVRTAGLDWSRWEGEINLAMPLMTLLALLPPGVRLPITSISGDARLSAQGDFDRGTSAINLQTFELRTGPVTLQRATDIIR